MPRPGGISLRSDRCAPRDCSRVRRGTAMAAIVEVPCPNCEELLKVPETVFGKKIRCKYCGHAFVVDVEDEPPKSAKKDAVKPSKPGGASIKPKAKEPPKMDPPAP